MLDKLVELVVQFISLFYFARTVESYKQGVILRFGKFNRIAEPGFHWMWPFAIEEMYTTGVVDEPIEVGPQSLTTKDGKSVVVSALFVITVDDIKKFILDLEGGNMGILLFARGALAELVQTTDYNDLAGSLDEDDEVLDTRRKPSVSKKLASILRRRVKRYGSDVTRAQIIELTQAKSFRLWGGGDHSGGFRVG